MTTSARSPSAASPLFLTTRWSLIARAREAETLESSAALELLCEAYWYPLYAWVRRQGRSPHDAQDLTQSFFAQLLGKGYLRAADREKGRFRTFLLVAFQRFLANEWDRARAQKRGGGAPVLSIDADLAELRYAHESVHEDRAELEYDRRWALTLLDRSLATLRQEYTAAARETEFHTLKGYLTVERGEIPYAVIAASLQLSEAGARSAVHRLRKRFRQVFRATISDTVSDPAEVEAEIRHIVRALGNE